jgi:hypothetical protein
LPWGVRGAGRDPQSFGTALADDMAKYDEIVRLTGITVD